MTTNKREVGKAGTEFPMVVKRAGTSVRIYRVERPGAAPYYQLADYSTGKRRLRSFVDLAEAKRAAIEVAERTSRGELDVLRMTPADRAAFVRAVDLLKPTGVPLEVAAATFAQAFAKLGGNRIVEAAGFFAARHKSVSPKSVSEAVEELLTVKRGRGASVRYLQDLESRLGRFARDFSMDCSAVDTGKVQAWLDGQAMAPQSYKNCRTTLHTLFEHALARGYCADNPIAGVERVKVRTATAPIYTAAEFSALLAAADEGFRPIIAIGGLAGLRSAELERIGWGDVKLAQRCIIVGASSAKTASRRVVPVCDALASWLAPYLNRTGPVWPGSHDALYDAQQSTAKGAGIAWKANGLRHSYASYRFAQTGDAGRVAGELGNSASVVHRHYRELTTAEEAASWFSVKPQAPSNVTTMPHTATA